MYPYRMRKCRVTSRRIGVVSIINLSRLLTESDGSQSISQTWVVSEPPDESVATIPRPVIAIDRVIFSIPISILHCPTHVLYSYSPGTRHFRNGNSHFFLSYDTNFPCQCATTVSKRFSHEPILIRRYSM